MVNTTLLEVLVLNVAPRPAAIVVLIVDPVPICTNVSPIETTGTFTSFSVIERELPIETLTTESTKITVEPIPTVCPVVVTVVKKLELE